MESLKQICKPPSHEQVKTHCRHTSICVCPNFAAKNFVIPPSNQSFHFESIGCADWALFGLSILHGLIQTPKIDDGNHVHFQGNDVMMQILDCPYFKNDLIEQL